MLSHDRTKWIDLISPTPQDVDAIGTTYPYIHPLNLEDLLSPIERPKLDLDEDYLFVVLHFPLWDAAQRLTRAREVDLILGRGYVITIHDGTLKPLITLFDHCQQDEAARAEVLGGAAGHAFYVIIDRLVDYILPILRKVDANIRELEESIFTTDSRKVIRDIAVNRRDIIALRRIIRQQVPIMEALETTEHPILHEDLEEYFGDIVDHIYKARDIIDENAEIITGLAETADTLASHRINEVMRILTVISVIMLPLTLISSVYGMNIDLPFEQNPNAFIIVSGGMVMITLIMLVYFRRRNWL
jgi:magnesium transporter